MALEQRIAELRAFNRFYTNLIGVLRQGYLRTPYTLTESRLIFELAQADQLDVADLRRSLDIDAGYLSRILKRFEADGIVERARSAVDRRRQVIRLTSRGRQVFGTLNSRSAEDFRRLLGRLPDEQQADVIGAPRTIRNLLGEAAGRELSIRPAGSGDYGWVVSRHGALYAQEHGWDETFEGAVAAIVAGYLEGHDPARETAWIAEVGGLRAGSVFCVARSAEVAQLRLLLVEPWARGVGAGSRLIQTCLDFARQRGYRQVMLWTNDVLVEARRLYVREGFELRSSERHHSYGQDLVGEDWWLTV